MPASLSGQFETQGRQALAGLRAWAANVNASGGIRVDGRVSSPRTQVEVCFEDDASKVDGVRKATDRLITASQVHLLFGPYSSVLTSAAAAVAEERGRLLWNQGGASAEVYRRGYRGIIGILTPADRYLAGLLPMVREADAAAATVGIIRASRGAFPKEVTSPVEDEAERWGFRLHFLWEYASVSPDYSKLAAAAASESPDVLLSVGRIGNDIALAPLLADKTGAFNITAVVAAPIEQFRQRLGEKADGFLGPSQWEPQARYRVDYGPRSGQVMDSLSRHTSLAPDYPMVQAYAAGLVAQRCIETAGLLDEPRLREVAAGLDFSTFYGRFKIDPETGLQVGREVVLAQWQEGVKTVVWPPEQREKPLVYPWR